MNFWHIQHLTKNLSFAKYFNKVLLDNIVVIPFPKCPCSALKGPVPPHNLGSNLHSQGMHKFTILHTALNSGFHCTAHCMAHCAAHCTGHCTAHYILLY